MAPARTLSTTRAGLRRLLAGWLVVIVSVQGLAAAGALVFGPLHRHLASQSVPETPASIAAPSFAAGVLKPSRVPATPPATHYHDQTDRHYHAGVDLSAAPEGHDAGLDPAAQAALAIVFSLLVLASSAWNVHDDRAHVGSPTALWALAFHHPAPPRRPPRF